MMREARASNDDVVPFIVHRRHWREALDVERYQPQLSRASRSAASMSLGNVVASETFFFDCPLSMQSHAIGSLVSGGVHFSSRGGSPSRAICTPHRIDWSLHVPIETALFFRQPDVVANKKASTAASGIIERVLIQ